MIKDFIIRKMMEKQLAGMPKEDQERLIKLVSENPELFKKIGEEVEQKRKSGMDPKLATMDVVKKYQAELQELAK